MCCTHMSTKPTKMRNFISFQISGIFLESQKSRIFVAGPSHYTNLLDRLQVSLPIIIFVALTVEISEKSLTDKSQERSDVELQLCLRQTDA